jgi:hypothetical protein
LPDQTSARREQFLAKYAGSAFRDRAAHDEVGWSGNLAGQWRLDCPCQHREIGSQVASSKEIT